MSDPCQSCGACCAYSDDWPEFTDETNEHLASIPLEMCNIFTGRMWCYGDRCCALRGEVGKSTSCAIYERRPNVCREFEPASDGCNAVRQYFGLPPLSGLTPRP